MANRLFSRIRYPVRREGAELYLLITLLSFAASVVLTRLFLELTGYPRVGSGGLHIAHVLWGGLLLFVASVLPLTIANRWAYTAGALLSGIGVGLFIDEVGKFITQTNDYFFPAAAPIIYAFFLLGVLVFIRVSRPRARDARTELYRALDGLEEVLEHDLDPQERADLEARLRLVAYEDGHPDLSWLAQALLDFLTSDTVQLAPDVPTVLERHRARLSGFEAHYIRRSRVKAVLTLGYLFLGLPGIVALVVMTLPMLVLPDNWQAAADAMSALGQAPSSVGAGWFRARLILEAVAGLPIFLAAVLLVLRRDRTATTVGYFGLLLSLTVVNLLVFYFDQFSAITRALVQFALLLATIYYQQSYLVERRENTAV